MNSKKPAPAGFFLAGCLVHLEGLLLIFIWVKLNSVNCPRLNNNVGNRFMGFERATAIDILTLVITFFGI